MLFSDLRGVTIGARQAHQQFWTETEGPIVPAVRLGCGNREAGPVRELRSDQPGNQRGVDLPQQAERAIGHDLVLPISDGAGLLVTPCDCIGW